MEVRLPIQATEGRGGWKLTSDRASLPPSRRFACMNPLRGLPSPTVRRQAIFLLAKWPSSEFLCCAYATVRSMGRGNLRRRDGDGNPWHTREGRCQKWRPSTCDDRTNLRNGDFSQSRLLRQDCFWDNSWFNNKLNYNRIIRWSLVCPFAISLFSIPVVSHYHRVSLGPSLPAGQPGIIRLATGGKIIIITESSVRYSHVQLLAWKVRGISRIIDIPYKAKAKWRTFRSSRDLCYEM